ncbi:MAG: M20/M25/M40 family metallo-hydrolase, partial [Bacteroidota bacterium]|nr:M20/M25/M40 family metallo-hydrolase [Bacteroidota bacterium]
YACPHGVISMSQKMPGMVETSTNLASVKFKGKNRIDIVTSQRSDIGSGKEYVSAMVRSVFTLAGAKVKHSDGYPGWSPNPDSEIMKLTRDTYTKLFGNEPVVRSIHAGLECGLFLEKYPGMDMISFGPTLRMVHSPDEKIHIGTVQKFWDLLIEVLKSVE